MYKCSSKRELLKVMETKSLEERKVIALESISDTLRDMHRES